MNIRPWVWCLVVFFLVAGGTMGGEPQLPSDPRDIPVKAILTSLHAKADLNGDGPVEEVVLIEALTGKADPAKATEIIVGVAGTAPEGTRGPLLWRYEIAKETGQPAHGGEVATVDLDGDGRSEMILTWDRSVTQGLVDRCGVVWAFENLGAPRRVWEGSWERDTRRHEATPPAEREKYRREIDYSATRREAGRAIVFKKAYGMIAGRPLDPPRVSEERVDVVLRRP